MMQFIGIVFSIMSILMICINNGFLLFINCPWWNLSLHSIYTWKYT